MSRYVVDTSSLVELAQIYPRSRFPSLWKKVGALVADGRMSAPWQVYKEIERRDDELFRWAREHRDMFEKDADEVTALAASLIKKYRRMRNRDVGEERADAYVIALAHHIAAGRFDERPVIVTEEGRRPGSIPRVAELYGLTCIRIADVVEAEGLNA